MSNTFVEMSVPLIEKDVNTPRFFCINSFKTIAIVYGSSPLEHPADQIFMDFFPWADKL